MGTWHGTVDTPYTPPRYDVDITFEANGHYKSACSNAANCRAFYYGSDDDSPLHTYDLNDVFANRTAAGWIYLWSQPGSPVGELKSVTLLGNATRLKFEFFNGLHGPFRYDLYRVQ